MAACPCSASAVERTWARVPAHPTLVQLTERCAVCATVLRAFTATLHPDPAAERLRARIARSP